MIQLHLITREQAQAAGLKRYYTGKPCKYNQYAERRVCNNTCTCFICYALLTVSNRQWQKKNTEKHNEINRRCAKRRRIAPQQPTFEVKA